MPGGNETYMLPHWEDRTDAQRYLEAELNGTQYRSIVCAIHDEYLEKELADRTLVTGQDWYDNDKIYQKNVKTYKIRGIREDVAIAVRFNDDDKYAFGYTNDQFVPETLGDLMEALNFDEFLVPGVVYYELKTEEGWKNIGFEGLTKEMLESLLFADTTVKNDPEADKHSALSIGVEVAGLGIGHHKSIWVTEDGWIGTNLLETGKYFHIGEEKTAAFKKYVMENLPGYEYIYEDDLTGEITIE